MRESSSQAATVNTPTLALLARQSSKGGSPPLGLALHLLGHRGCHRPQRGGMVPWRSTVMRPASQ